jgi:RHS repeat-associated protein
MSLTSSRIASVLSAVALAFSAGYAPLVLADGDPGTNLGQVDSTGPDAGAKTAGPIQYATGNLILPETDFAGKGEMALFLTRTFNNYWDGTGIFGAKWESNFDYKLSFGVSYTTVTGCAYPKPGFVCTSPPSTTTGPIWLHLPNGSRLEYKYNTTLKLWQETTPSPISTIVRNADGTYTVTDRLHGIEHYNAMGDVLSIMNAQNIGWTFVYDANNYLQTVTHSNGRFVKLTWTGNLLTAITDQNGATHTYQYNANNELSQETTNIPGYTSQTVSYDYENKSFPTSLTGKDVAFTRYQTFGYDASGNAITSSLGAKRQDLYTYTYTPGSNGALTVSELSPLGRTTVYNFTNGLINSATASGGTNVPAYSMTHTYDSNGFDALVSDFNGNVASYTYAANGQLQQVVQAYGKPEARTTKYTWDPDATRNRITRIVVGDRQTDYTYDPATQRIATTTVTNLSTTNVSAPPMTTTYTYANNATNGMLDKMVVVGPAGAADTTTALYNVVTGDLNSVKNSLNQTTTYSNYNKLGQAGQIVGPNGDTTVYTYDARGEVVNVQTTPNGFAANTVYTYDGTGALVSRMTPDGVTENYMYDDTLHLIARYKAANGTISGGAAQEEEDYLYDANEDVTETDDYARTGSYQQVCTNYQIEDGIKTCVAWGNQWVGSSTTTRTALTTYDGLGRPYIAGGNGNQNFVTTYDGNGNVLTSTDSLNHTTTHTYDGLNRLVTTTDAKTGLTQYGYDAGSRVTSITDPRFLITTYVYDGFGQLWAQSSPDTGTVSFTWDGTGHRTGMTRADGTPTSYTYDSLRRVKTIAAGGKVQTFTYDTCTNGIGRLCGYNDAFNSSTDSLTTTYTPQGQVSSQSSNIAGNVFSTSYTYDNMGHVICVTYPDGAVATYTYASGKLSTVTATLNGATNNVVTGLTYQPYDDPAGWTYGNGLVRGNNYDLDGRLTGISTSNPSVSVLQSLTFSYDADNQIHAVTNAANTSLNQTFGYDSLIRLTSATAGAGSPANGAWNYDADSNRSNQTDATGNLLANHIDPNSNYLLWQLASGIPVRKFTVDANGNRLTDSANLNGAVSFHYDPFNRMDSATSGGVTTTYHVDPLGRRIYKWSTSQAGYFVYSPDNNLLSEMNASLQKTDYVWMGGQIVAMVRNNTVYMVHTDRLGRPEIVTDPSKAVVWRANNLAFDRTVTLNTIGGLNIGFPGQYYDAETNLWNNGYRDYDATVGRYIESDPMGLSAGINTFGYVGGNPVTGVDPSGLDDPALILYGAGAGPLPDRTFNPPTIGGGAAAGATVGALVAMEFIPGVDVVEDGALAYEALWGEEGATSDKLLMAAAGEPFAGNMYVYGSWAVNGAAAGAAIGGLFSWLVQPQNHGSGQSGITDWLHWTPNGSKPAYDWSDPANHGGGFTSSTTTGFGPDGVAIFNAEGAIQVSSFSIFYIIAPPPVYLNVTYSSATR